MGRTLNNVDTKDVEIAVPLKYLINSGRTVQIPLINCKIALIVTWSANCYICCNLGNNIC